MKTICLILYVGICTTINAQTYLRGANSDTIRKLCAAIAEYGIVESQQTGSMGTRSQQYKRYKELLTFVTDSMLFELTFHESPTIRLYSYWGLIERENKQLLINAIRENENDTVRVFAQTGCIRSNTAMNYRAVSACYFRYIYNKKRCALSSEDCQYITKKFREEQARVRTLVHPSKVD